MQLLLCHNQNWVSFPESSFPFRFRFPGHEGSSILNVFASFFNFSHRLLNNVSERKDITVFPVRLENSWSSVADILGLCNVLDKLQLCRSKIWKILIAKKYSKFTIRAWTPIILPLISGSNFSSREMVHKDFIAVQLSRILFKMFTRTVHPVGQRTLKPEHSNERSSRIFEAFFLFLAIFDKFWQFTCRINCVFQQSVFFYHVIYC